MKTYERLYKEALERARIWKEKSGMPKDKQGILDDIFPELKKQKPVDKTLEVNLEKEIESYLNTNRQYAGGSEEDLWGDDCIRNAIKHGADWQKEQMMKSAIDAIVDEDTENSYIKTLVFIGKQRNALNTRISNYEFGEMVKIIILKEDEQ